MLYQHAIIGGTFDHFHIGHQAMLNKAFEVADKVSIGITTTLMFQNKTQASTIQSFKTREQTVKDFLKENNWTDRASILPITNKYGSMLVDPSIEAIIVSPETKKVAEQIVKEREKKGLSSVEIITVPFVLSDDGKIVSSENIRLGRINSEGLSYRKFLKSKTFHLPDHLRVELQKPIGHTTTNISEVKKLLKPETLLITVGDIATTTLLKEDIRPDISIIDLRTRREDLDDQTIARFFHGVRPTLTNPAGTISPEFTKIFAEKLDRIPSHEIIRVQGEEDLLTLPAILLSPLGTTIIYGQINQGMVIADVTEEKKLLIKNLLSKFK